MKNIKLCTLISPDYKFSNFIASEKKEVYIATKNLIESMPDVSTDRKNEPSRKKLKTSEFLDEFKNILPPNENNDVISKFDK